MADDKKSILKRFLDFIISIGPAFFVVGYTIGTGSIVTMASAGSRYGMAMLWALVLACFFSFVLLEAYGRYTIVTGEGSLYGIKKHIAGGKYISVILLAGLIFVEVLALIGIMGIVTELIHDWTGLLFGGEGWNSIGIVIGISIIIYGILMTGKYSIFEKVLIVFVGTMGISFLMTLFFVPPSISEMVKGLIPTIPEGSNATILIAAIVGTTFTAPTFVVRGILMKEKTWDLGKLKHARKDAIQGAVLMFFISVSVMAVAATAFYPIGRHINKVVEMIDLLKPLLGEFAVSFFVLGIISAAMSSVIPIIMLAPLLISDYRNEKVKYKGKSFRIISGIVLALGFIVPAGGFRPVFAMIVSQAFQVFLLPAVVFLIMHLVNNKYLMKDNVAGKWLNFGLITSAVFSLYISYPAIIGLIESFNTIF